MTIVEFLNARLDEQDADGRSLDYLQTGEFLLADAAAKRRIVERYREAMATASERDDLDPNTQALLVALLWPLYDLGAVYADHPDYNPEWKP